MVCPITNACFRELNRTYFVDQGYLYEDLADSWMEVGAAIQRDEPSEQSLRLRGFYLVELIYRNFAFDRAQEYGHSANNRARNLIPREYPRSYEGLTAVIRACERERYALTVDQGEMLLVGGDHSSSWKLLADRLDVPKFMLTACTSAATRLRSSLASGTEDLTSIGHLFATVLVKGSVSPSRAINYLRTSLLVNIHNPISPFNRVDF